MLFSQIYKLFSCYYTMKQRLFGYEIEAGIDSFVDWSKVAFQNGHTPLNLNNVAIFDDQQERVFRSWFNGHPPEFEEFLAYCKQHDMV